MAGTEPEPPQSWKYCGEQVKLWRQKAGLSREDLGRAASYAVETIASMELGRRRPTKRLLTVADELFSAEGFLVAANRFLMPDKYPLRSLEFMQAEQTAVVMHAYEALLIPGLLQTEEYAKALIGESCPPLDDDTIDERALARIQRQAKLSISPPVLFSFVIYEAALRTGVGGEQVMRNQLRHLVDVGVMRNISVQVLPIGKASAVALSGPVVLLEDEDHQKLAYVEGQEVSFLHSDPKKVSSLAEAYGMIRMQALSTEESARFITELAEEA